MAALPQNPDEQQEKLNDVCNDFTLLVKAMSEVKDPGKLLEVVEKSAFTAYYAFPASNHRRQLGDCLARKGYVSACYCLYRELLGKASKQPRMRTAFYSATVGKEGTQGEATLPSEVRLMFRLRMTLWNYSDCSQTFSTNVAESGFLEFLVADLKELQHVSLPEKGDNTALTTALGILYNCGRNPENRRFFRQADAVASLEPFLKSTSQQVKMTSVLTVSHVTDNKQSQLLLADDAILDLLLRSAEKAWSRDSRSVLLGNTSFSLFELVSGLAALARNDNNKSRLAQKGALKVLREMSERGSDPEAEAAVSLLWQLCFATDAQSLVKADGQLVSLLEKKEHSANRSIAKAACCALWLVRGLKAHKLRAMNSQSSMELPDAQTTRSGHVMISYAWNNQKVILQVRDGLLSAGYRLWVDVDQMGGSTLQAMAEAVENATVVIIAMSDSYQDSQNCRMEAEYACRLKRDIVPLMLHPAFKADGWLGIIQGARLYFDFSGRYPFQDKLQELIRELGNRGKAATSAPEVTQPGTPAEHAKIVRQLSVTSVGKGQDQGHGQGGVKDWTAEQVQEWLKGHNLHRVSGLRKLTGEHLAFLKKLSLKAPEYFYSVLERRLKVDSFDDVMKFSEAIDLLQL